MMMDQFTVIIGGNPFLNLADSISLAIIPNVYDQVHETDQIVIMPERLDAKTGNVLVPARTYRIQIKIEDLTTPVPDMD